MADTVFGRMFLRTAASTLLRQFGETVTYHPADGTQPRAITAMVERQPLTVIPETGEQIAESIIVRVKNDGTLGIASEEVDTGGDEIELPTEVNARPQKRSIVRVLSDSNGLVRLLCQ